MIHNRVYPFILSAAFAFLSMGIACSTLHAGEKPAQNPPVSSNDTTSTPVITKAPQVNRKAVAARVDTEAVTLDDVFEIWGAGWYEVINRTRAGDLTPAECNKQLQSRWTEALDTVIRDEMFYQAARSEFEKTFQKQVDSYYEGQRDSKNRVSRDKIETKLRERQKKVIEDSVENMITRQIRSAGGAAGLKRVLDARGIAWEEWRQRQIRKAYTYQYLHMMLDPVSGVQFRPADIRKFYRENPELFTVPGNVTFRHILFAYDKRGGSDGAYRAAWNVYEAIQKKSITFAEAAKKHSDDPISKERGGLESRKDTSAREDWLTYVREAAREEKPGVLGPLLESAIGYHLVMLEKKEEDDLMPFRQAQTIIEQQMRAKLWEAKTDKHYRYLRERMRIEIKIPNYPKQLSWSAMTQNRPTTPIRRIGPAAMPDKDLSDKK